jgi:hypothetical protein
VSLHGGCWPSSSPRRLSCSSSPIIYLKCNTTLLSTTICCRVPSPWRSWPRCAVCGAWAVLHPGWPCVVEYSLGQRLRCGGRHGVAYWPSMLRGRGWRPDRLTEPTTRTGIAFGVLLSCISAGVSCERRHRLYDVRACPEEGAYAAQKGE